MTQVERWVGMNERELGWMWMQLAAVGMELRLWVVVMNTVLGWDMRLAVGVVLWLGAEQLLLGAEQLLLGCCCWGSCSCSRRDRSRHFLLNKAYNLF
jgi:hypothetical protein